MGQNNDITEAQAQTINYVGEEAYKFLYKYLKPRIDGIEEENRGINSRMDEIEEALANVVALTIEELQEIMQAASSSISISDYTKN